MPANKWEKFQSKHSPIQAASIDTGKNRIVEDWQRFLNSNQATINGVPIATLASGYKFDDLDKVKDFFRYVILKDLDKTVNKERAVDFLMSSFHQGGLMYPVSTPLTGVLLNKAGQGLLLTGSDSTAVEKQVHIVTNKEGFSIQEFFTAKKCIIPPLDEVPDVLKKAADDEGVIYPAAGKDYVIKAAATVHVDFSRDAGKPNIAVEENLISYGNSGVEKALDKRSLFQIVCDALRRLCNFNEVKVIEKKEEPAPPPEPEGPEVELTDFAPP